MWVCIGSCCSVVFFFFFKQKTAYEMQRGLVGSEMCIRDRNRVLEKKVKELEEKNDKKTSALQSLCDYFYTTTYPKLEGVLNLTTTKEEQNTSISEDISILRSLGTCLLYTSDAADDTPCVDLGGRRIIKKKKHNEQHTKVIYT
eukprot:TRINITY_DN11085_c0_g1_i4.p2 TRINITY_DN11085_c0_g1~~TRINITY_DN11085_c0_g1_i4.p2  ORF type:complete len:144 (-),score=46.41 TRINITY_DN11085_c0_g1_i4:36-467(-)